MAISDTQKVDYLWKKVGYGRVKTDTNSNKLAPNEAISSPLFVQGTTIWSESAQIPAIIPASTQGVVNVRTTSAPVELTADNTATANRTWKTGLTDWIPPQVGSTYLVKVYIHTSGDASNAATNGDQVFVTGSGNNDEWFFDYQAGVLHFIGSNLPNGINFSGKSVYISGAYYTGIKGVVAPGTAVTFSSIDVSGIVTATSFQGDGSALSGIITSLGTLAGIATLLTGDFNDGDIIQYSSTQGKFIATANSVGAGRTTLISLDDVVGTASTNDVLFFNGSDFTFTTPFEIVDRADGSDDDELDYGSF